jgi:hypothetical protein
MAKTLTGGRAKVYVNNQLVGIFESCNYNRVYGTEAIHILGRYTAAEIAYTSVEAVTLTCSGFRVVGNGVHVLPAVPKVQDILNFQPFVLTVVDRQTGETVTTINGVTPNGDNGNYNAKASSRVTVNYMGIIMSDEDGDQSESAGATDLP